ncbi:hypothetical protein ACKC9G_16535 [Pokkaliibacter sp. CJK22405]|uniref:hypothetical protein n=1 Tax=Pokkaliibacter sp. CJK22405 TaxID=3384615 RepID=UPI0039851C54
MKASSPFLAGTAGLCLLTGLLATNLHAEESSALSTLQQQSPLMALISKQVAARCNQDLSAIDQTWLDAVTGSEGASKAEQALREDKPDRYQTALESIACPQ